MNWTYILFVTIFPIFPPISEMNWNVFQTSKIKFAEITPEDIMSPKDWEVDEDIEIELEWDKNLNEF